MQLHRGRLALTVLALVYAALLANALIGYVNVRRLYENDRWVIHTHEVIHSINLLYFLIVDVETAQRGYITTGESAFVDQYDNALAQTKEALATLEKVVDDNASRRQDIADLKQQIARKLAAVQEIVALRKNSGFEAAQALILSGESRRAMEVVRQTISRLEFDENRLLVDRQTQSEVSYRTAVVAGTIASLLGICLSIFASILIWREIDLRNTNATKLRAINDQLAKQTEQLAGFNLSLTAQIAERTRAEAALQEADQRKDQFLATLAHELRNPLSPLLSAAQLLSLEPNSSLEVKEMAAIMLRQVEQLKRLIDDLLDVSRISRGKLQLQREPTLLSDAVSMALDVSRTLLESKHHQLLVSQPEQPVLIYGDKVRLAQIIGNLLINAAKYTPPSGHIELDIKLVDQRAVIHVRDNGIGIEPDMLQRIFGLFAQADTTNERSHGGLGIGLSLAKTLVEMHGGSIQAASAGLGQGSQFVVSLPLANQPAQPAPVGIRNAPAMDKFPTYRCLVVDDNESASHLLSKLLAKLGQDVRIAHSAETAIALTAQWQPHVLISDIAMPEMSGYELAERICGLSNIPRPMLIALTGYGQESDRQAALAAGFEEHLTKPIGMPTLQSLLERVTKRMNSLRAAS